MRTARRRRRTRSVRQIADRTPPGGRSASSRTSTRRSSGRRSSCTHRATRARWPSWRRARSKPSRRPGTRAARPRRQKAFAYVHVVLNEGARRRVEPAAQPLAALLAARAAAGSCSRSCPGSNRGRCGVCDVLREERLEIALRGDVVAPRARRPAAAPYELCSHRPARRRSGRGGPRRRGPPPSRCDPRGCASPKGPRPAQRLAAHGRALAPRGGAASDRLRRPRARRRRLRQLTAPGGGRATPQGVGSASGCRSARGSGARRRSPRRGSGPCPSPA